ncbi:MAG: hypothetical protein M3552_11130 [Planctomycetota bacterium]|nr:hypothetical protein [Planctomycetaceae bacterium]MDQ3331189.1 hypothetical protein [Planctomycetota bacterium]
MIPAQPIALLQCLAVPFVWAVAASASAAPPDFAKDVQPLLTKYCAGCHNAADAADNGAFSLDNFTALMKGGEHGAVIVPGKVDESRIIKLIERADGPAMPPEDEPAPSAAEIAVLKAWIEAGAEGPIGDPAPMLNVPKIEPTAAVRRPVHAAAWSPDGEVLAVGRYQSIELLNRDHKALGVIEGLSGQVNVLAFLPDGKIVAAGGEPGLAGEVTVWNRETRELVWKAQAHRDAVTAGAVSGDGTLIATGSYDQTIIVWDAATGAQKATLTGHNHAVFGLAFHPTKPILASASGDRTIKLWNAATGARLDTLIEPTKEQVAIAFSPDGSRLAAAGADSRIRIWSFTDGAAGGTKIRFSHFAHEGPIVSLAYAADGKLLLTASEDKTVKTWDAASLSQVAEPASQPDWVAAIAASGAAVALGRLDGSVVRFPLPAVAEDAVAAGSSDRPVIAEQPMVPPVETPMPEAIAEVEPNDAPANAVTFTLPGVATGVLQPAESHTEDADYYRFAAKAGEAWIFETNAARSGSPADTKIDVLHADGAPVERVLLRATRDSAINFRGFSSVNPGLRVDFWEEMELNEYMYLSGEVCRIFRMPQGPDSDMQLYSINGQRRSYLDTTPVAHALGEAVYIVTPHAPGTVLPSNGLPVFSLPFESDDDAERKLGRDSKLAFTAPADGEYVVRVRDVRGAGGPEHKYTLTARVPKPDFAVSIAEGERKIAPGGGQRLTLKVDRADGFTGPVRVEFADLPAGLSVSTPVVIEEGHAEAKAVLTAAPDATSPADDAIKAIAITATAAPGGLPTTKPVAAPAKIAVGDAAKIVATLTPVDGATEIVLRPGGIARAMLSIERNGYDGELNFDVENLPHGVIVDHIGLSGVLIRTDEDAREVEFKCANWVSATDRQIFAVGKGQGDPASKPVTLRVVRDDELAKAGE